MSSLSLPVRAIAIEWRYKANLAFYSKMDAIGLDLLDDFPDWKRSALVLEVQNYSARRRFFMSYDRTVYHVVDPADFDVVSEIERAEKLFGKVIQAVGLAEITRVGMRQWVAFAETITFAELVSRFRRRLCADLKQVDKILAGTVSDVGYITEVDVPPDWKYKLTCGPMNREQWTDYVKSAKESFKSEEDWQAYVESIPETFVCFDMDCYKEDALPSDLNTWVRNARSVSHEVMVGCGWLMRLRRRSVCGG